MKHPFLLAARWPVASQYCIILSLRVLTAVEIEYLVDIRYRANRFKFRTLFALVTLVDENHSFFTLHFLLFKKAKPQPCMYIVFSYLHFSSIVLGYRFPLPLDRRIDHQVAVRSNRSLDRWGGWWVVRTVLGLRPTGDKQQHGYLQLTPVTKIEWSSDQRGGSEQGNEMSEGCCCICTTERFLFVSSINRCTIMTQGH